MPTAIQNATAILNALGDTRSPPVIPTNGQKDAVGAAFLAQTPDSRVKTLLGDATPRLPNGNVDRASITAEQRSYIFNRSLLWFVQNMVRINSHTEAEATNAANLAAAEASAASAFGAPE